METLYKKIEDGNNAEIDGAWAILKSELGILRKLLALCQLFSIDKDDVLCKVPRDENSRILDQQTRKLIHEKLLKKSSKKYEIPPDH